MTDAIQTAAATVAKVPAVVVGSVSTWTVILLGMLGGAILAWILASLSNFGLDPIGRVALRRRAPADGAP